MIAAEVELDIFLSRMILILRYARNLVSFFIPHVFESNFIEIASRSEKSNIVEIVDNINREYKYGVIMGDFNFDWLKFGHYKTSDYLDNIFSHGLIPTVTKPTRVTNN